MFADDTKLYIHISDGSDSGVLQADLDCLQGWSEKWQISFNPHKFQSMELGNQELRQIKMRSSNGLVTLDQVVSEKDGCHSGP